jgi:hypothetical protein
MVISRDVYSVPNCQALRHRRALALDFRVRIEKRQSLSYRKVPGCRRRLLQPSLAQIPGPGLGIFTLCVTGWCLAFSEVMHCHLLPEHLYSESIPVIPCVTEKCLVVNEGGSCHLETQTLGSRFWNLYSPALLENACLSALVYTYTAIVNSCQDQGFKISSPLPGGQRIWLQLSGICIS